MATEKKATKAPRTATKKAPAETKTAATAETQGAKAAGTATRKIVTGTVVSDKMQKTIVVKVDRRIRHAFYKKYVVRSRRFKAHDEKNDAKVGDLVTLVETRPMSRDKRWALQSIVRRANQSATINV